MLRSTGKNSISVLYLEEGDVHEDDAALRLAHRLAGEGLRMEGPEEGKVSLHPLGGGVSTRPMDGPKEAFRREYADPDFMVPKAHCVVTQKLLGPRATRPG